MSKPITQFSGPKNALHRPKSVAAHLWPSDSRYPLTRFPSRTSKDTRPMDSCFACFLLHFSHAWPSPSKSCLRYRPSKPAWPPFPRFSNPCTSLCQAPHQPHPKIAGHCSPVHRAPPSPEIPHLQQPCQAFLLDHHTSAYSKPRLHQLSSCQHAREGSLTST